MNKNKIFEPKAKKTPTGEPVTLASEKDKKIFFNTLQNPPQPGSRLVKAAERYKQLYDPGNPL